MLSRRGVVAGFSAALAASSGLAAARRPDFSGDWNNASGTPLQRPPQFKTLSIDAAEAARFESQERGVVHGLPGDDVGQDGAEWFAPNEPLLRVRGEVRTSVIVDPPDGRLPYTPEGRGELIGHLRAQGDLNGPESRPPSERCLVGFGDPAAPPMLYMSQTTGDYQFVQTRDAFVIRAESNHDVRIVSLRPDAPPFAPARAWHGVSRGRWDGDSLVFETSGFHALEGLRSPPDQLYLSPDARVTERMTRLSANEILYEFRVEDPRLFSRPWRGEATFRRTPHHVLDYDCHEGNYALPNILRGARGADSK
ncbi:MAG: hypothetical protein JSS35_18740 [Proteobacteria bacterium]|nr:hypothetical protein [Pseudomonadota bacterium]